MTRNQLVIFLAILVAGCDRHPAVMPEEQYPSVVLREENGFAVLSAQHGYYRDTGRLVQYGELFFKINGERIKNEDVSNALFPQDNNCHSQFYSIEDIRLLPGNAVLALMSQMNAHCDSGGAHIAKISTDNNKLLVERLPVIISGREHEIGNQMFARITSEEYVNDRMDEEERLAVQGSADSQAVGIVTKGGENIAQHTVIISLHALKQIDMGGGTIERFAEGGAIALMRQRVRNGKKPGIQFKAVRSTNGKLLDHALYPVNCFRPVGRETKGKASMTYGMLVSTDKILSERAKIASGEVSNVAAPNGLQAPNSLDELLVGQNVAFDSEKLSGIALEASDYAVEDVLLGKESQLEWDAGKKRIKVTTSSEIRKTKACRLADKH